MRLRNMSKTKVFQIYYKEEQLPTLDPAFVPYDNTSNLKPELREWYVWDKEYQRCVDDGLTHWGFVSAKFSSKTNISGQQFLDFIEANPGHDVYFINPCIANEALFLNGWEQGDIHHAGLSSTCNTFLEKIGFEGLDVKTLVLDRTRTMFASYIVGSKQFWSAYLDFTRKIFTEAETDAAFKQQVFGEGLSNYVHDRSLSNFAFLNERLISTFIELKQFNAVAYQYTPETLSAKYKPYIDNIAALSNLKVLINEQNSEELYHIWNSYRNTILKNYPQILGLE